MRGTLQDKRTPGVVGTLWLGGLGLALIIFGMVRLLVDQAVTVTTATVRCGSALEWLVGEDNGTQSGQDCAHVLHDSSVEAFAALILGAVIFVVWLVVIWRRGAFRVTTDSAPSPSRN